MLSPDPSGHFSHSHHSSSSSSRNLPNAPGLSISSASRQLGLPLHPLYCSPLGADETDITISPVPGSTIISGSSSISESGSPLSLSARPMPDNRTAPDEAGER
ncbi:unnamed protein product [Protopolystoma xenopodis]|uniref:Uncharacterized protein n=1 Tax=Protopolystoma xenopodis TaxID=117903 RepID=A0A3S5B4F0_9PLAT|nr:unnamed protein product [Protopolystoma xenopodis]